MSLMFVIGGGFLAVLIVIALVALLDESWRSIAEVAARAERYREGYPYELESHREFTASVPVLAIPRWLRSLYLSPARREARLLIDRPGENRFTKAIMRAQRDGERR